MRCVINVVVINDDGAVKVEAELNLIGGKLGVHGKHPGSGTVCGHASVSGYVLVF